MRETGFICLPSSTCKQSPCPPFSQQRLPPSICLHSRPFSRRRRSKPWRSPGEGAEPTPPEKLLHELGEG